MKKLFAFILLLLGTFMLTATVAQAGNVLYAEAEGETMILKCADSAPEGLKVYDGTTNWQIMGVTTVIVDASCQSYTGNTLDYLFNTASNKLKTITGLNNLNTASVTSMGAMFLGCSGLTSIDISSFNTANVTVMSYMFFGCSALTSLDARSQRMEHHQRHAYEQHVLVLQISDHARPQRMEYCQRH